MILLMIFQFHSKHIPTTTTTTPTTTTTTTTTTKPSPEVFVICYHKTGGKVAKDPNLSHKLHSISNIKYQISNIKYQISLITSMPIWFQYRYLENDIISEESVFNYQTKNYFLLCFQKNTFVLPICWL